MSIFSCVGYPLWCFLWRNVSLDPLPMFYYVVCFSDVEYMSYLYILKINPLSVASFATSFSHSKGCLFILLMVSFAMQKLLSLIRSYLFIFVSIFITLGDGSKKILLSELLFQRSNFGIEIKGNKMLWRMANTTTACRALLIWREDWKKKLKIVLWK